MMIQPLHIAAPPIYAETARRMTCRGLHRWLRAAELGLRHHADHHCPHNREGRKQLEAAREELRRRGECDQEGAKL